MERTTARNSGTCAVECTNGLPGCTEPRPDYETAAGPNPPGTQSARPAPVETWGWNNKSSPREFNGAHVLYMDGHVEFVKLGTFPVVPEVMDVLSGIAGTQNELLRP